MYIVWNKGLELNTILSNPSFSYNLWLNLLILDLVMVYSFDKSVLTSLFPQGLTQDGICLFTPNWKAFNRLSCLQIWIRLKPYKWWKRSPTKALRQFTTAIHGPQKRCVAVATQASEEALRPLYSFHARGLVSRHCNSVQHIV